MTPTKTRDQLELGLWSQSARRVRRLWTGLSLSGQFLAAAAVVVGGAMILMGAWATDRIEYSVTRAAAEAGAIFMQEFLQPYVQDLPPSGRLPPAEEARLDDILDANDMSQRFVMLKIWRLDTTLVYSSNKNIPKSEAVEEEIREAAEGKLARHFEELEDEVLGLAEGENIPVLEVYAPLYRNGTNEIIAVGEFYQSAVNLVNDQRETRLLTWLMVGLVSAAMLGVLYLIVARGSRTIDRQRTRLARHFRDARRLAFQNDRLRKVAERASISVSEANETFLSRLGADIHDGPLQTLSLLMASIHVDKDGSATPPAPESTLDTVKLAKSLHAELRNISTGLILPEIDDATLPDVFRLAVERYEALTGGSVVMSLGDIPSSASRALKICCYRIVQEALSNGFHHAGGLGQMVTASVARGRLRVLVADGGNGLRPSGQPSGRRGLGLAGMRNRVAALKGALRIRSRTGRGTLVLASIPLAEVETVA